MILIPINKLVRGIFGAFVIAALLFFASEPAQIQLAFFGVAICIGLLLNPIVQKWISRTLINLAKRAYKVLITKEV